MEGIFLLIGYTFIGSIAGLIGGVILLLKEKWAKSLAQVSVPLAAGVLLSVSFLDLLPEAVEGVGQVAFTTVLIVFIVLFLVERFLLYLHHHVESGEKHAGHSHAGNPATTPLIIFGDTIHNFLDGVAIGTSYLVNPNLGLVVALSTFMHETPHEIADFGILLSKGWNKKKVFATNFMSALATFPGALLAYLFASKLEYGVGILMAVAAGFFLYVASTDFLPEATHAPRRYLGEQAIFLLLGVFGIIILRTLIPEIGH
jgi:zinc and cadmium transporter